MRTTIMVHYNYNFSLFPHCIESGLGLGVKTAVRPTVTELRFRYKLSVTNMPTLNIMYSGAAASAVAIHIPMSSPSLNPGSVSAHQFS